VKTIKLKEDKMAEDTQQTQIEQDNEAMIQEMLRDAEKTKVELDGDLTRNPVIHRGDEELAAPMIVKEISSAGYVYVYDTRTGEKIPVLYYMLPQKLRQRRKDGSFRFDVKNPGIRPKKGTFKCMLHPDSPNKEHYKELGFRVCTKSNITNAYQLKQHMIHKHPQEWAAIEEERVNREKEEDRALQRLLLASKLGVQEESVQEPVEKEIVADNEELFTCENCGKTFKYRKVYNKHIKDCKK
jgi:hypothetical protein